MFQPPRIAALGSALLRAALAAAVVFSALVPSTAEAQRGRRALRLQSLELVELGQANGRRGNVTRWGLAYRRGARGQRPARLEVTLERGPNRRLVRHVQLTGRHGTVAIGPARGNPSVSVRALDRFGRPMPIRVGRGARQQVVALRAAVRQQWRPARRVQPVTTRVQRTHRRTTTTVNGRTHVVVNGRTQRTVNGRIVDPGPAVGRGSTVQLAAADRACRDAFTGNENEMRCLQLMRFHAQPAAQVAACEDAFTGDAAELRCLEIGAAPRHVAACEDLLTGDAAELRCLETVASSRARPAMVDEVLRICDGRVGDEAELLCVADLLAGRRAKR